MPEWTKIYERHRPYLISFAFRMTGSLSEAEDLVQDTFMECANVDPAKIENHKAWLTKVCSNKCLDHLKQAYKKRETYRGPWLPDAIPDNLQIWSNLTGGESPEAQKLHAESLTTSFLLLIERLSPEERVIYLLSEIFDYSFKEIAEFLDKTDDACRKAAQRAREAIVGNKPKLKTMSGSMRADAVKMVQNLFIAAKSGNATAIADLLASETEFWSDGGGKVSAAPVIMKDRQQIAKFLLFLGTTPAFTTDDYRVESHQVNGTPGMVVSKRVGASSWEFDTIIAFEFSAGDGKIARIFVQRNPDKLRALL